MEADKRSIERFIALACGDAIQLAAIPAEGGVPVCRWFGDNNEAAAEWAVQQNANQHNIYWAVNRVTPDLNKKATKADIESVRFAHLDIDPPTDGSSFEKDALVLDLELVDPTPTLIVDSGGGLQAFWRVDVEASADEIEEINRALAHQLGGDLACTDISRIMRMPGTVNYPNLKKRTAGRVPILAAEITLSGPTHTVAELAVAFRKPPDVDHAFNQTKVAQTAAGCHRLAALGILPDSELHRLVNNPKGVDRSRDTYAAACEMVRHGLDEQTIMGVLLDPELEISAHCLDQSSPERAARRAVEKARSETAGSLPNGLIKATPYALPDPRLIPQRRWLYGRQLLRGTLSVIVAPGGTGKTALTVGMALALATGRPLLGKDIPEGPKNTWLWNSEVFDELDRTIGAACLYHDVSRDDITDRLFVDSGLDDLGLCTATHSRDGFKIIQPVYDSLLTEIRARGIDVLIVDPFVSSHAVPENDNGAIDAVAKGWARIAAAADCSVILVHHTSKSAGMEVTAERSRGASALVNAARSVFALNRMSEDEALKLGVSEAERRRCFRAYDDKNNRAPPAEASDWYQLASVSLPNGEGEDCFGDSVGVVVPWTPPTVHAEALDPVQVVALQTLIEEGAWREHQTADLWAGKAVAQIFELDLEDSAARAKAKAILKECLRMGWLRVERRKDSSRRERNWIVKGKPIELPTEDPLAAPNCRALQCSSGAPGLDGADWSKVLRSNAPPLGGIGAGAERPADAEIAR